VIIQQRDTGFTAAKHNAHNLLLSATYYTSPAT